MSVFLKQKAVSYKKCVKIKYTNVDNTKHNFYLKAGIYMYTKNYTI